MQLNIMLIAITYDVSKPGMAIRMVARPALYPLLGQIIIAKCTKIKIWICIILKPKQKNSQDEVI